MPKAHQLFWGVVGELFVGLERKLDFQKVFCWVFCKMREHELFGVDIEPLFFELLDANQLAAIALGAVAFAPGGVKQAPFVVD